MANGFAADAGWFPHRPDPSRPKFVVPDGSTDAHCHVFGPGKLFPYAANRRYTPTDASKEQLFALRDLLGFERNVIVQATCHGTDNRALIDALTAAGDQARGVASIAPSVSRSELQDLHEIGVRGIRFNFLRRLGDPHPDAYYRSLVDRIAELGWHVVAYFEAPDLEERWDLLTTLPTIVVVDHLGRPDVTKPVDGPAFGQFIRLMREHENIWTKVSCPERLSKSGPPNYDDVIPFARRVIARFPKRVLWGTDWPHPNMTSHMPDDGALVDLIPQIATTPAHRQALLVDNPTRLYWEASQ